MRQRIVDRLVTGEPVIEGRIQLDATLQSRGSDCTSLSSGTWPGVVGISQVETRCTSEHRRGNAFHSLPDWLRAERAVQDFGC